MYKLIKIFTIFFGVLAILGFVWVLSDGQGVLLALEQTSVFFGVHIALIGFLLAVKHVSKAPMKDTYAYIVNLEERFIARHFEFLITFKLPDNSLWTCNVPAEIYHRSNIGQYGKLTYREKNSRVYFVFFTSLDDQNKTG